jgi:dihydroflavonol-4-reductase
MLYYLLKNSDYDCISYRCQRFLGGALARALVQKGQDVRVFVRKTSNLTHLGNLPIEVVYGSLEDKTSLIPAFDSIENVYHCAALSTDWGR